MRIWTTSAEAQAPDSIQAMAEDLAIRSAVDLATGPNGDTGSAEDLAIGSAVAIRPAEAQAPDSIQAIGEDNRHIKKKGFCRERAKNPSRKNRLFLLLRVSPPDQLRLSEAQAPDSIQVTGEDLDHISGSPGTGLHSGHG